MTRAWVSSTPLCLHTVWNRPGRILQCYSETLQQSKETSLSKRKKAPAVQPFNLSNIPMPDRGLSRFEAVAVMPPFCIVFVPAQPRSRRRRAVCQAPGNASGKHTLRSARVSQQRILCVLELSVSPFGYLWWCQCSDAPLLEFAYHLLRHQRARRARASTRLVHMHA